MSVTAIVASVVTAILSLLIHAVLAPLDGLLSAFAAAGAVHDLTGAPWAQNLIAGSQAVAGAVLAMRTAWEALMLATARTEGAPTDPGALLKRVVLTAAAIAAGPALAVQAMRAGNLQADAWRTPAWARASPTCPATSGPWPRRWRRISRGCRCCCSAAASS